MKRQKKTTRRKTGFLEIQKDISKHGEMEEVLKLGKNVKKMAKHKTVKCLEFAHRMECSLAPESKPFSTLLATIHHHHWTYVHDEVKRAKEECRKKMCFSTSFTTRGNEKILLYEKYICEIKNRVPFAFGLNNVRRYVVDKKCRTVWDVGGVDV